MARKEVQFTVMGNADCKCNCCVTEGYLELGFSREEFLEIADFFRELLRMRTLKSVNEDFGEKQASRIELVRVLRTIKKFKIVEEKRVLQKQIERLNSL